MTEKPKREKDKKKNPKKSIKDKGETGDKDSWSRDQREKSYYYDDSHGYEIYNPDEEEEEKNNE